MQIDDTLLSRLENLSHLKVSDDKRKEIIAQLSEIVSFVDNLSELNTEKVEDTFAMSEQATRMREDEPQSSKEVIDDILSHAPNTQDDFFIVPKIIE